MNMRSAWHGRRSRCSRRHLLGMASLLLTLRGGTVMATAVDSSAEAFIQRLGNQTLAILDEPVSPEQRLQSLKVLLDQSTDLELIARLVLGRYAESNLPRGGGDAELDQALGYLYDREYTARGHRHAKGGSGPDELAGTDGVNQLYGNGGADRLVGRATLTRQRRRGSRGQNAASGAFAEDFGTWDAKHETEHLGPQFENHLHLLLKREIVWWLDGRHRNAETAKAHKDMGFYDGWGTVIGQLARRYKLPWRSSGMLTGSKLTDAQAGYESAFNMFPIMLAGANYVMHCAGWTEAGLTASFAKFMLDAEQMEMLWKFGHGPRFEDFDEAIATVSEVGPGGHFLGTAHTQAHFQEAFFMSELFDNNSFEQWQADGAKDAATRGLEAARKALDAYVAPPLDPVIAQAVEAFIREREAELPDEHG